MDPWSMIGQGIAQGFGGGMQNPESQLFQLFQKKKFGGANPAAVNTIQQQMMQPADMGQNPMMGQAQSMVAPSMQPNPMSMGMPYGNNPYQRFRFF